MRPEPRRNAIGRLRRFERVHSLHYRRAILALRFKSPPGSGRFLAGTDLGHLHRPLGAQERRPESPGEKRPPFPSTWGGRGLLPRGSCDRGSRPA